MNDQNVTTKPEQPAALCSSDLLAAWDVAHDALTDVADAARKLGHEPFAREAETIADSLESRVTALSNMARAKAGNGFARSPDIIKAAGGPQMEDFPDWDSWYFARQKWVFERMSAQGKAANDELSERRAKDYEKQK